MAMSLEDRAKEILSDHFPQVIVQPASISGKYHIGETVREHLELTANVMRHLCNEFNIHGGDRDMLIACSYLHDLALYVITRKGEVDEEGWKYYPKTGWSRLSCAMKKHGSLSAELIDMYAIERSEIIKDIVKTHMSHWYKDEPQPKTFYQRLLCIADYVASRGTGILEYEEER